MNAKPFKTPELTEDSLQIYMAWLECQKELENPKENAKGNFGTYAKLEEILDTCLPIINKHGFYLKQSSEQIEDKVWMITELVYKTGDSMISRIPMYGDFKDMQKFGAAITYARRYSLCMLLGLEGERDLDEVPYSSREKSFVQGTSKYTVPIGMHKGKSPDELSEKELQDTIHWIKTKTDQKGVLKTMLEVFETTLKTKQSTTDALDA